MGRVGGVRGRGQGEDRRHAALHAVRPVEVRVARAARAPRGVVRALVLSAARVAPARVLGVLPASFSSAWLAWRSGARARVGFRGEWRDALLTEALPRAPRGERHLADEFLDLGARYGVHAVAVPALRPTEAAAQAAAGVLERAGIAPGERYAILGPRSAYGPAREWFPERFVAA